MLEYGLNGNEPETDGIEKTVFVMAKPQIDKNNQRYMNGKKGGRNRTETEEEPNRNRNGTDKDSYCENTEPNVNDNVNVKDNDNEKENVNAKDNVKANLKKKRSVRSRVFSP